MTIDDNVKLAANVDPETGQGLIIEKSDVMKKQRMSHWSFKVYSWLCWLYLLRSAIILVLWYMGIRMSYFQMVDMHGWDNFEFFFSGTSILAVMFLFMFYWNRYNFMKFRGTDRRKPLGDSDSSSIARYYDTTTAGIEQMKSADTVEVEFRPNDTVELRRGEDKVTVLYAPQNLDLHFKALKRDLSKK